MPLEPRRPCAHPGCHQLALTNGNRCARHQAALEDRQARVQAAYDARRGTAADRGYDGTWRKIRDVILREFPLCEKCQDKGVVRPAVLVHHIDEDAHNNRRENLMSLCRECHERIHGRLH